MPETLRFTVPAAYDQKQAKLFLKGYCGLSTRMITSLKRETEGIVSNGKILRTVDTVRAGQVVTVTLPEEESPYIEPVEGEPEIVFEDSHLLIANKPPFMPVHPVKQYQTDTLANGVVAYSLSRGERYVFRAVNRLDRNTSGLVMIAKNRFTVNRLKNCVHKTYLAAVHGEITQDGTVCAPIGLQEGSKIVRCVTAEGTPAVTHYAVLYSEREYSLLRLWLETGKTHQIRCHMSYLGHPLLGDDLYGGTREKINRHALHCAEMHFRHPVTGEDITVQAALPQDMAPLFCVGGRSFSKLS